MLFAESLFDILHLRVFLLSLFQNDLVILELEDLHFVVQVLERIHSSLSDAADACSLCDTGIINLFARLGIDVVDLVFVTFILAA